MAAVGVLVRFDAKPDKVTEVEAMLKSVEDHVREEGLVIAWFALRLGPASFAIFDTFASEADRDAHLEANRAALRTATADLFAGHPSIEYMDVPASIFPGE